MQQEKQEREAAAAKAKQERAELYRDKPDDFFTQFVGNRFCLLEDGRVGLPITISGKVLQITPQGTILLETWPDDLVAVTDFDSSNLVDGNRVDFEAQPAGRFQYVSVMGSSKTVRKYGPPKRITAALFDQMRTNGFDFLEVVEADRANLKRICGQK